MIAILEAVALLLAPQVASEAEVAYHAELKRVVRAKNDCVQREVDERVPTERTSLDEDEKKRIAVASANACYDHARSLAMLTSDVRQDKAKLKQATVNMLVSSMSIAYGLIAVRLNANKKSSGQ